MKTFVLAAVATVAAAANSIPFPSQTLNSVQAEAIASLSAAQASLNAVNSHHVADNKASQAAAIHSQSVFNHNLGTSSEDLSDLGDLDYESMSGSYVHEQSSTSSASSVAGSMLALALMAGVAMF
ncbi:hypothetical protein BX661DRAFT_76530 [Kickxella alabastrina]|uniref:uncharacterized protein n=1 Tax=Kickxella alabastrina TaxID=61397 RepID=UPI00221ECF22|nr:uncharacterized protein BX661DRAFT_76530 [Kickxella alabastrina]KAI7833510.1 hypothetical protein BX661DRAFT_76530 [Kickxella alabastrina]KAJ1940513.1 hypothetical protein GGF37_003944 [Kickxella alabastrina]